MTSCLSEPTRNPGEVTKFPHRDNPTPFTWQKIHRNMISTGDQWKQWLVFLEGGSITNFKHFFVWK